MHRMRITILIALLTLGAGGAAAGEADRIAGVMDQLRREHRVLRMAFNAQQRPLVDAAGVVERVGDEPAALQRFVHERTYYLPYRGSLRGARGVLIAGGGSHCDRAVLLAACLRAAGYAVELRRGTLSDAQVDELLPDALARGSAGLAELPAPGLDDPELEARIAAALGIPVATYRQRRAALDLRSQEAREEVVLRSLQQQRRLADLLGERLTAGDDDHRATFAEHWWVAFRDAESDDAPWRTLDPLADPADPAPLLGAGSAVHAEGDALVPREQRHRLRLRAVAEVHRDDGRREHVLLEHELDPRSLQLASLQLLCAPLGWNVPEELRDDPDAVRAHLLEQGEWMPTLRIGDDETVHQKAIRADGTVNADPAENAVEAKLGGAAQALAGMGGGGAPEGHFTALWWEWTWLGPGADERPRRRMSMDLVGPAARADGWSGPLESDARMRRALQLATVSQVLVQTGRTTPPVVRRLAMVHRLRNESAMLGSLDALRRANYGALGERLAQLSVQPTQLHNWHLLRTAWNRHRERVFVDRPQVIGLHIVQRGASDGLGIRIATDVVYNGVGVLPGDGPSAARVRLEQGVRDTALETVVLRTIGHSLGRNPSQMMADGDADWTVVDDAGTLSAGADWQRRIAADQAAGALVVAPDTTLAGGRFGWWRVQRDGTCLGMGVNGWGPESVDYLSTMTIPQRLLFEANMFMVSHSSKILWACIICQMGGMGLTMSGVNLPEETDIACKVVCAGAG